MFFTSRFSSAVLFVAVFSCDFRWKITVIIWNWEHFHSLDFEFVFVLCDLLDGVPTHSCTISFYKYIGKCLSCVICVLSSVCVCGWKTNAKTLVALQIYTIDERVQKDSKNTENFAHRLRTILSIGKTGNCELVLANLIDSISTAWI